MKSDVPWQVTGVRREARDTAQEAARRSGMSVGEWLDNAILDSALHDGVQPRQLAQPQHAASDDERADRTAVPDRDEDLRPRRGEYAHDDLDWTPDDNRAPPLGYADPYSIGGEARERPLPYARPYDPPARTEDRYFPASYREPRRPDPFARADPLAGPEDRYPSVFGGLPRRPDPFARPDHQARTEDHGRLTDDDARPRATELAEGLSLAPVEDVRPAVDQGFAELHNRLDNLTKQLGQIAEMNAASAQQPRAEPCNEEAPHQLVEVISRLDHRLDDMIAEARSAKAEMEQRVSAVADLHRQQLLAVVNAEPQTPLDQALIEIADRQRTLDGYAPAVPTSAWAQAAVHSESLPRPRTQELAGLEQQLRQINTQMETLRQPCSLDKAVDTLRDDLAEIGVMVQDAMPRKAVEALEGEVRKLASRVELIGGNPQDPAAIEQLEGAIVAMRGIVSHVASNDALAKLSEEVRAIGDKVEQAANPAGSGVLSALEGRIAMLADALEARNRNGQNVPHQLETVVAGLVDKIERVQLTRGDQVALGHLEDRIAKLVEKLDASDARLNQLESIERGLADLLVHLEHQRAPSLAHAGAASPDMDALSREVADLKQSGKTTQDSLEVVHGTLGQVVDRLAMIETDMRARPAAIDEPLPARLPSPLSAASAMLKEPAAAAFDEAAATPAAETPRSPKSMAPPAPERRPIDPNLPPDHPLEPGSGATRGRGPGSPADRIAASEAALAGARPPVVPDPAGGKANFIAAARRAAQAAGREAPAKNDQSAPAEPASTGGKLTGRSGMLRGLLGGAAAVLVVLASLHIARSFLGSSDVAQVTAPSVPSQTSATTTPEPSPPAAIEPEPPASLPAPAEPPTTTGRQSTLFPAVDGTTITTPAPGIILPVPPRNSPPATERDATGTVAQLARTGAAPTPSAPAAAATTMDKLSAAFSNALRTAATKGDPAAQYEVALRYAEGRGVTQNLTEAAEWFERAAKQGLVPAQFRLGGFYEKGLGVTKNLETARRFYAAAGEAGNAKALHNLAVLYAEGIEGKPDYQTAAKWFRKAADYGVTDSQYNLAILYARGIGVEQNLAEAYKWFVLAARDGDADAAKKRDDIGSRLDQRALKAATQAAQGWRAEPQPDAAVQVKTPAGGWDGTAAVATPAAPKRKPPAAPGPALDLTTPRAQ
jgi:localization factor PodJL